MLELEKRLQVVGGWAEVPGPQQGQPRELQVVEAPARHLGLEAWGRELREPTDAVRYRAEPFANVDRCAPPVQQQRDEVPELLEPKEQLRERAEALERQQLAARRLQGPESPFCSRLAKTKRPAAGSASLHSAP